MKKLLFKLAEAQALKDQIPAKYEGKQFDALTVKFLKALDEHGFYSSEVRKKFPQFKFVNASAGAGAYIGPRYVVKDPFICQWKGPPRRIKCPTKILKNGLYVQPKCKVFSQLPKEVKAEYVASGKVQHYGGNVYSLINGGEDAHEHNFGVLNGELRVFDW